MCLANSHLPCISQALSCFAPRSSHSLRRDSMTLSQPFFPASSKKCWARASLAKSDDTTTEHVSVHRLGTRIAIPFVSGDKTVNPAALSAHRGSFSKLHHRAAEFGRKPLVVAALNRDRPAPRASPAQARERS